MSKRWHFGLKIIAVFFLAPNVFAQPVADPCGGETGFLALVNRPTISDSACVVKDQQWVLESGYQYQHLNSRGHQHNFPNAEARFGLAFNNELFFLLPNRIVQSLQPKTGWTATSVGLKHEFGYTAHWLAAIEGIATLPSGSHALGSRQYGTAVNGIVSYTFNRYFSFSAQIGVSSQTNSRQSRTERFNSFNPDAVLTWAPKNVLAFYAEAYGQTNAGPGLGSGYNANVGMVYLLYKNFTVDFEVGQRISGQLGRFERTIGAGFAAQFV